LSALVSASVVNDVTIPLASLAVLDKQLREIEPFHASEQPCVVPIEVTEPDAVQRVADAIRARSA
jgi:hypothetical protein